MTRMVAYGLLVAVVGGSVGCKYFDTNRTLRGTAPPDSREYSDRSVPAQEKRGRARYALTEDDFRVGPKTYADRPDPIAGGISGGTAGPQ